MITLLMVLGIGLIVLSLGGFILAEFDEEDK